MADNLPVTPGSGATIAADEIAGVKFQRVKMAIGADGEAADLDFGQATKANSLPVALASDQDTLAVAQIGSAHGAAVALTRPANTTVYTAGDVVGGTANGGAMDFPTLGKAGGAILITGAALEVDIAAVDSGMTSFRLHLYNALPPSAIGDNNPFDLAAGDRSAYVGYIDLGTPVDFGSTLYCEVNNLNKQVHLAGGSQDLFGYLVTNGGFTPGANSEGFKVTLHTVEI
jgi:hypothetical protein